MRAVLVLCLVASGPVPAAAGPWLRTPGTGFVSLSREVRPDGTDWSALYAEYGVSERLTAVLDAGSSEAGGGGMAIGSVRVPLWQGGAGRVALGFGLGEGWRDGGAPSYTVVQGVLSWGRSFERAGRSGWTTLDATVRDTPGAAASERKLDATLGAWMRPGNALIGQAQFSDWNGGEQLRLGFGWVTRLGPVSVETGVGQRLRQGRETDLKIGLWVEF
uniref:hypothetical protein n=1 Tax=Paenirhodobacter enshiensis TaxID=1105367 RepID=UPI0035B1051E